MCCLGITMVYLICVHILFKVRRGKKQNAQTADFCRKKKKLQMNCSISTNVQKSLEPLSSKA